MTRREEERREERREREIRKKTRNDPVLIIAYPTFFFSPFLTNTYMKTLKKVDIQ
jgi:hypothetical protein